MSLFDSSYLYCIGLDTPADADDSIVAEFDEFYTRVHMPDVLAENAGFTLGHRYELSVPDDRGLPAPRWVAFYETDAEGARRYVERDESAGASDRPAYTEGPIPWPDLRPAWRVIWRSVHQVGVAPSPVDSIHFVGMDVPPHTTDRELEEFNDFYSTVHVREALEFTHCQRGTRFEARWRPESHVARVPRFSTVYEADPDTEWASEKAWAELAAQLGPDAFSPGPRAWEDKLPAWRVTYKRLAPQTQPQERGQARRVACGSDERDEREE
jgi:hypothetical protein